MDIREALLALEEGYLKKVPGLLFVFLRLMKEEKEPMPPGLRSLSNKDDLSDTGVVSPSAKIDRVGESLRCSVGAFCKIFDSKKGKESSKESDFGRGIAPLMVDASSPCGTSCEMRKSIASLRPPALLRVYVSTNRPSVAVTMRSTEAVADFGRLPLEGLKCTSTSYWLRILWRKSFENSAESKNFSSSSDL